MHLTGSVSDLKNGFVFQPDKAVYCCLFCGQAYAEGEIFPFEGRFFSARRMIELHIQQAHGGVFAALLSAGKRQTGLTDVQRDLMAFFYQGLSDKAIAEKTGTSLSTVRTQRFTLREKAKQARLFLVLSSLMEENMKVSDNIQPVHDGATMVDERYVITDEEAAQICRKCFLSMEPLVLRNFPPKEKKKVVILRQIAALFSQETRYTEKEVNGILQAVFHDYVTLRRYLIEYGFMDRTVSGSEYWLK